MSHGESEDKDYADGPTLEAILEAVIARNEAFETLATALEENTIVVRETQRLIQNRPSRQEVVFQRRRMAVLLSLFSFFLIWFHDAHIESCSPGARAVNGIDFLLKNPPPNDQSLTGAGIRQKEFERVFNTAGSACDVSFPLHTHNGTHWPSTKNVVGLLGYMTLLFGVGGWVFVGYRAKLHQEHREGPPTGRRSTDGYQSPNSTP